jgi:hypothetical protein
MKNENLPAMPFESEANPQSRAVSYESTEYYGLSKLEYAAIHIASGIFASGVIDGAEVVAVSKAKALFKELEKQDE